MPHFRFRAIDVAKVRNLASPLISNLQGLMQCPAADFTIEHIPSTFIGFEDKPGPYPFVEILWFDRGQEVQDRTAEIITRLVREELGSGEECVAVIFHSLTKTAYYDNGAHY